MAERQPLKSEEREFFSLLADLIFSNPFGGGYERLRGLLGRYADPDITAQAHQYGALMPALEGRLQAIAERGIGRLQTVHPDDVPLLSYAYLFRSYQHHVLSFDRLIRSQMELGERAAQVSFAPELMDELRGYGFGVAESHRYMALIYQLRRAYYFIDHELVGDSPSMQRLRRALWNSLFTTDVRIYASCLWDRMEDFSTLLLGETGTGKGSAAASIGRSGLIPFDPGSNAFSVSFTETFIATNLSQFPESLIESELFGHRKGAFTGAVEHHKGLFERCNTHGALFLDEIGDVAVPIQIKLLKVLEERSFSPVGSHKRLRFRGRVIAATNRPLEALRRDERFREDFFYRLSSNVITVPPLRERLEEQSSELEQLTRILLERMAAEEAPRLLDRVMSALERLPDRYPWPGNVRELEQALRRIILNGEYVPDPRPEAPGEEPWLADLNAGRLSAGELLSGYCRRLYTHLGTYEAVAKRLGLDRRTVKKHIEAG
jgi:transcriptional regulator with PAS, ATPase and Fis domain